MVGEWWVTVKCLEVTARDNCHSQGVVADELGVKAFVGNFVK